MFILLYCQDYLENDTKSGVGKSDQNIKQLFFHFPLITV